MVCLNCHPDALIRLLFYLYVNMTYQLITHDHNHTFYLIKYKKNRYI